MSSITIGRMIAKTLFLSFFLALSLGVMYAFYCNNDAVITTVYPPDTLSANYYWSLFLQGIRILHFIFGFCALPFVIVTAAWGGIIFFSSRPLRYFAFLICVTVQLALIISWLECIGEIFDVEPGAGACGHLLYWFIQRIYSLDVRIVLLGTSCLSLFILYGMYRSWKYAREADRDAFGIRMDSSFAWHHDGDQACAVSTLKEETDDSVIGLAGEGEGNAPNIADVPLSNQKTISKDIYKLPTARTIFSIHQSVEDNESKTVVQQRSHVLKEKLSTFGIQGDVVAVRPGPVVTLYEYQPHIAVKVSKITSLEDDLALALQANSLRIIAPIPGKNRVGFEVANQTRKTVFLGKIVKSRTFLYTEEQLPLVLGANTMGETTMLDLARSPHLLVAGSTGSGKSVALNVMLASLLLKKKPDECRLVLIDPKRLEFASYEAIPHLLFPVITDPKHSVQSLGWLVQEMERRYKTMSKYRVRNIVDYNKIAYTETCDMLSYIVVVIDELADLMMICAREIEQHITRLTQMARAAGIHLILATQRPSVDVITGLIKVNIPTRIAFRVATKIDSRTILGTSGAEKLLGHGDMLLQIGDGRSLQRIHGAYIHDSELEKLVAQVADQASPEYINMTELSNVAEDLQQADDLLCEVESFLDSVDEVSISLLQREFRIGYNRSARLISELEQKGRILPPSGTKMRKIVKSSQ